MLGGGQVAGLLRFQNNDLAEGRNLLGRMAVAISESLNTQNRLGLTLDGKPGQNLFAPISLGNAVRSSFNTTPDTTTMALSVSDPTLLQASSYTISYSTATTGSVTRHSDGKVFSFDNSATPPPNTLTMAAVFSAQGLSVVPTAPPAAGARPSRRMPTTMARKVENSSFNCRRGVSSTGQSSSSWMPRSWARPSMKLSVSKVAGAARRCSAASATSRSGLITTSMGR